MKSSCNFPITIHFIENNEMDCIIVLLRSIVLVFFYKFIFIYNRFVRVFLPIFLEEIEKKCVLSLNTRLGSKNIKQIP